MTTVTLNLPEPILQRANKAAAVLHRSLEEVLAATLASALPDVEDAPDDMQAELLQMTWLDDRELLNIAHGQMPEHEQTQLANLGKRMDRLTDQEWQALQALREGYGRITLRKARAYALLGLRGGKDSQRGWLRQ
jgi:hypothetical protein